MSNKIIGEIRSFLISNLSIMYVFEEAKIEPIFADEVPTAAIMFEKTDVGAPIKIVFNPNFWESCTYQERCFLFAHEMYHILLNHGTRGNAYMKTLEESKRDWGRLNRAMDICINEILKRDYFSQFHESLFPTIYPMMCDIKNCFNDDPSVLHEMNFIYYYELLTLKEENEEKTEGGPGAGGGGQLIDSMIPQDLGDIQEIIENIIEEIQNRSQLTPEEIETRPNSYSIGSAIDPTEIIVNVVAEPKVDTLEDALKLVVTKTAKIVDAKIKIDWMRTNRRAHSSTRHGLHVPNYTMTRPHYKPNILVYADVSGSVAAYSEKFFKLISQLDLDKYELDLYAWATAVSEVKMFGEIAKYSGAGYGTNIDGILNHQANIKNKKYDAVVVITDGGYTNIRTNMSRDFSNWYFFYIKGSNVNNPTNAKSYMLKI